MINRLYQAVYTDEDGNNFDLLIVATDPVQALHLWGMYYFDSEDLEDNTSLDGKLMIVTDPSEVLIDPERELPLRIYEAPLDLSVAKAIPWGDENGMRLVAVMLERS